MAEFAASDLARLRELVGRIVPASEEYAAPGADDPSIFDDIAAALAPNAGAVRELLQALNDPELASLAALDIGAAILRLSLAHEAGVGLLIGAVMQSYYRDARVMRALGMEPRPPFPKGFEVEDGDWTLLDPVRARATLWRDAP